MPTTSKKPLRTLSSPNNIICTYCDYLEASISNLKESIGKTKDPDDSYVDIAVSIILAVTVIEMFLNIYFRGIAELDPDKKRGKEFLKNIKAPTPLDTKVKKWPKLAFGKSLNFKKGIGKDFLKLKDLRNKLVHFSSDLHTVSIQLIPFSNFTDTTVFHNLKLSDSENSLKVVRGFIKEIFILEGISKEKLPEMMQYWTGFAPEHQNPNEAR